MLAEEIEFWTPHDATQNWVPDFHSDSGEFSGAMENQLVSRSEKQGLSMQERKIQVLIFKLFISVPES
jgi:hypothetical protein